MPRWPIYIAETSPARNRRTRYADVAPAVPAAVVAPAAHVHVYGPRLLLPCLRNKESSSLRNMTKVVNIAIRKVRFLLPPEARDMPVVATPPAPAQRYKRKVPRARPSRSTVDAPRSRMRLLRQASRFCQV